MCILLFITNQIPASRYTHIYEDESWIVKHWVIDKYKLLNCTAIYRKREWGSQIWSANERSTMLTNIITREHYNKGWCSYSSLYFNTYRLSVLIKNSSIIRPYKMWFESSWLPKWHLQNLCRADVEPLISMWRHLPCQQPRREVSVLQVDM
jgi:hypothetical protein